MSVQQLSKLYDKLTPRERLPLLLAAGARGDEAERVRLQKSAPERVFQAPDYYSLAQAHNELVSMQMMILLDLATSFWRWWGLWMIGALRAHLTTRPARGAGKRDPAAAGRTLGITRYHASRFVAHVEGWNQFCDERHIDPENELSIMPGWQNVQDTEREARTQAFSAEEAARFVLLETEPVEGDDTLERGPEPVETAAAVAAGWHKLLDNLVQRCGGAVD